MTIKHVDQSTLESWVDELIRLGRVYGAQAKADRFAFGPLTRAGDLRLDYDVTILPPKKYFQPQKEVLLRFDREKGYETVLDDERFVLFGVHPYDYVAIDQLDEIFSSNNYDAHYMTRRESATIVVSDVQTVSADVFAGCMGNATVGKRNGFDVLLTKLDDDSYVVDARTERGESLVGPLAGSPDADEATLDRRKQEWARIERALRKHDLRMDPERIPELLGESEEHPVWKRKADLCYSCGSCNLVCPTCYCFDVQEDFDWSLQTGERTRVWDGCMLSRFAEVAGNHNFRSQKEARYRHRYYRKGKYVWDTIGQIACVGCGRCISACTANIANPAEIFNTLLEERP